jgi:polyisoprenoid-binding protein YceI
MATISARTTPLVPTGTWVVDPAHSSVEFSVKHMGIANVRGAFKQFDGTMEVGEDIASARIRGSVDVASIDTNDEQRDEHLRSADFFDVEHYPKIEFECTRIAPIDDESSHVFGNLTMHGITKEIRIEVVLQGTDIDPWGNERVGLEGVSAIKRSDFDMKFNQALGSGNMLVGDKVSIMLDISAVKQTAA